MVADRREFLLSMGRWSALAGLGALGVVLVWSSEEGSDSSCTRQALCEGCSRFSDCELPQAMTSRDVENGAGEGGNG